MAKQRTDTESVLKLIINGQQAKTSVNDLRNSFFKYNAELANMKKADDPRAYAEKATQVKKLKDAWTEARNEINGTTKSVKGFNASFADIAKGVFGGQMLTRAWDMASRGVVDFISRNAELSDMMASVIKTTGLNEAAVDRLNEKFKKFDTRSAKEELMSLAYVAGKVGYTLESDVEAFVRAADKIGVALGEELGGTEDAVRSIGKLVDIFKVSDSFGLEESLLKVGSIINELGQAGTANEKYLVDFTQRMAGIAPAAGISMQNVMGMAATLDELGQQLESSSTAIGQFIVKMGADIPKFAKVAGMSVTDFAKLLKEDANEAFLRVLESSNSAGGGIQQLAENMGLINVAGARGIAALGVLSSNVDKLREKQALSNDSFDEGTSILKEFDNVNNNLAANIDKLKNRMAALWENSRMRGWFTDLTAQMLKSSDITTRLSDEFYKQQSLVKNLESSISPLITQYEELKNKGELNKDEQTELNVIISKITDTVPHAAVEFDKYGRVIAISTEKVKEFIEVQQAMLNYQNQATIKEAEKDLEKYNAKITELQHTIKTGRSTWVQELFFGNETLKLNDKAYEQNVKKLSQYGQLKKGAEQLLKSLKGDDLDVLGGDSEKGLLNDTSDPTVVVPKGKSSKKKTEAEKRAEEIKKDQEDLKAFLAKNAQEIYQNSLEGAQKELAALQYKYDEKRKLAYGDKALIESLNQQESNEFIQLLEKTQNEAEKTSNELAVKKAEIEQKIFESGLSARELEIELEKQKYDELILLAEQYGFDVTALIEEQKKKLKIITDKHSDDDKKKEEDKIKEVREFALDSAQLVSDTLFQIGENSRRAKYDKEFADLDRQKEKELSNKNLTEAQKEAINKKYDAKNRELKRKEFKENQRAAIAEAFINMALGIGKAIPNKLRMAFAGAAGLAQIAVISSQKPHFAKGGILPSGSSHAQGGIDLWDQRRQQIIGNIEGGEPILSKATYANNREIVDGLLYSSQRKAGARIQLNPEVLDAERMVRNGGYAMSGKQQAPVVNVSSQAPDLSVMVHKMEEMISAQKEANDKDVIFSTRAFEDLQSKLVKLKTEINA